MSDQAQETPLLELVRRVPRTLRGEWEIQWAEDGTPTGHSLAPVGKYLHELAERIESLAAENAALREAQRWIPVTERLPDPEVPVLATYKNVLGNSRRIRAIWVPKHTREDDSDGEIECDYSEEKDAYYVPEGWYEKLDNWDLFGFVVVTNEVTHWQLLPPPPEEQK